MASGTRADRAIDIAGGCNDRPAIGAGRERAFGGGDGRGIVLALQRDRGADDFGVGGEHAVGGHLRDDALGAVEAAGVDQFIGRVETPIIGARIEHDAELQEERTRRGGKTRLWIGARHCLREIFALGQEFRDKEQPAAGRALGVERRLQRLFAAIEPREIAFDIGRARRKLRDDAIEPARFGGMAKAMLHERGAINRVRDAARVQRALEFFEIGRLALRGRRKIETLLHLRINRGGFVQASSRFKQQRARHIRQRRGQIIAALIDAFDAAIDLAFGGEQERFEDIGDAAAQAAGRTFQHGARIAVAASGDIVGEQKHAPDRFFVAARDGAMRFTHQIVEIGFEQRLLGLFVSACGIGAGRRGDAQSRARLLIHHDGLNARPLARGVGDAHATGGGHAGGQQSGTDLDHSGAFPVMAARTLRAGGLTYSGNWARPRLRGSPRLYSGSGP